MTITTDGITKDMYRPFGRTGLMVSPLGFGGAPVGMLGTERDEVGRVLNALLDHGVNLIDTASCYYGSEEMIGNTIADRRSEYILVSKCGHSKAGDESDDDFTPTVITSNVERSLKRLNTDHLDVLLLHTCSLDVLKAGEALGAAVKAREQGKVRFVGYSGDNEAAAHAATLDDIAIIQTSVSICDQVNIQAVLPSTLQQNIGVMAKRPLANAAWKTLDDQYERYRGYAQPYHERFASMGLALDSLDLDACDDLDRTKPDSRLWAELALRFTLSIPGVHVAIVGTTSAENALSNVRIATKGPLPKPVIASVQNAFQRADPDGAWVGLT
ncbi:MAG: aldo/keto reductase [Planctomycetes bacterium]|nr:aldo/keto reductase [Planctomycetota bacterium]NOG55684.1 aldo/keto reductase [Planctomycetota bacterium]